MSRRRKGNERGADKTLQSYRQVLDSMVNFLGASGALLRQRIETGQVIPEIDCEAECLACSVEQGIICEECAKTGGVSATIVPKECAATKSASGPSTTTTSSSTLKNADAVIEVKGTEEQPAKVAESKSQEKPAEVPEAKSTTGGTDSSVCVCSQVRKIREVAGAASATAPGSSGRPCACKGKKAGSRSLCACPPSANKKQELQNIIAERLNTVSKLVNLVQVDLSNLSGQSKSAALYQEIMKEGPPLGSSPPKATRTCPNYPMTSTPEGRSPGGVLQRQFDQPGISPVEVSADGNDGYNRQPTPTSLFTSGYPTELPINEWANFVHCMFRQKRDKPGHTMLNFTEPALMQDERRYRSAVAAPGPAYASARQASQAGPVVCTSASGGSGYGNLQRIPPGRNLADSQQYAQSFAQYRSTLSSSGGSSRGPGNYGNLQRARANFGAASNVQGSGSSGSDSQPSSNYGQLQAARNRFCPVADLCNTNTSRSYAQPQPNLNESGLQYVSQSYACTDEDCDNEQCDS